MVNSQSKNGEASMARMTFQCGLSADRETAVLEMHEEGKPLAHMTLDAATLEGLIRQLGQIRAVMAEPVPDRLDPGSRVEVSEFPAWWVPATHSGPENSLMLALRHHGLGWIGFLLAEAEARKIGNALLNTIPNPPQP